MVCLGKKNDRYWRDTEIIRQAERAFGAPVCGIHSFVGTSVFGYLQSGLEIDGNYYDNLEKVGEGSVTIKLKFWRGKY